MKVIHRHALWAWMHAQNLCLIDQLVLGRHKIRYLEMETGAMLAIHLLIAIALCQMEHIKATSCWSLHGPKHLTIKTDSSL
jgi:hypothetical protein